MAYLLKFIEFDLLGNYDSPDIYLESESRSAHMLKGSLYPAFGNPVYYNPQSTYYPPGITSGNARVPTILSDFFDGEIQPQWKPPCHYLYGRPGPERLERG